MLDPLQVFTSYGGHAKGPLVRQNGPQCLWNYLFRSALVLAHHPTAEAVTTEAFVLKANDCTSCAKKSGVPMLEMSKVLKREIQKTVDRVSLPLYLLSRLRCSMPHVHTWQVPLPRIISADRVEFEPSGALTATN
jgi:hypothetical protein